MQDTINASNGRWAAIRARVAQFNAQCAAEDKLREQIETAQAVADRPES